MLDYPLRMCGLPLVRLRHVINIRVYSTQDLFKHHMVIYYYITSLVVDKLKWYTCRYDKSVHEYKPISASDKNELSLVIIIINHSLHLINQLK